MYHCYLCCTLRKETHANLTGQVRIAASSSPVLVAVSPVVNSMWILSFARLSILRERNVLDHGSEGNAPSIPELTQCICVVQDTRHDVQVGVKHLHFTFRYHINVFHKKMQKRVFSQCESAGIDCVTRVRSVMTIRIYLLLEEWIRS